MRNLPLLLAAAMCAGSNICHATGDVAGQVLNHRLEPLHAASVLLTDAASEEQRFGAATGTDGRFVFLEVPEGTYNLVVRYLGFEEHFQRLELTDGENRDLEIVLVPQVAQQSEVVITAGRALPRLTPITFSRLSARELAQMSNMRDLPAHLSTLPSTTYYSENGNDMGYTHLRIRGFGQRRLAVAINGIPQNDPEEHNVFWINFFDLQGSIKDIQVQRGAGSAFYGSTGIGGAVNIVADPYKHAPYAAAEVGYGTLNTQRYTVEFNSGLLGSRYVAFGRFSHLRTDGYRDWSWSEFWRFFAGVTRYGDRHSVTLQTYGGPQEDGLAYSGIPKAANKTTQFDPFGNPITRKTNFSSLTRDAERFRQPHVELHHRGQLSDAWTMRQSIFWIRGNGYFDFDGSFRSADYLRLPEDWRESDLQLRSLPLYISAPGTRVQFRAALDQWQAGWMPRFTRTHALGEATIGAEARLHRSLRWGRIQESNRLPERVVGSDNDVRVYSIRGEKTVMSLFASQMYRPRQRVALQADMQITWRQYRVYDEAFFRNQFSAPYFFVNPRIGVTINPERSVNAYASVALASREPRMKSLYDGEEAGAGAIPQFELGVRNEYDYNAPFVRPEQLLDLELGVRLNQSRATGFIGVYWMAFTDEIIPSGGVDQFGVPRTGNADKTRHAGLEVETTLQVAGALSLYGNATISRNRFVKFEEHITLPDGSAASIDQAGNRIPGFPDEIVNLGARLDIRGMTLRSDIAMVGEQYIGNSNGKDMNGVSRDDLRINPYTLVNATVRYAFPDASTLAGMTLTADVTNVLNSHVLLSGNEGFGAPQFFPASEATVFVGVRYTVR